jgi:prepilin-type N-terminal cleavage/methylation domain-containing protein
MDPKQNGNGSSMCNGFTVVELLICVALVLIVSTLAISPFNTGLEKRQLSTGAEAFKELFRATQSEAISRNQPLAVNMLGAGSTEWCIGVAIGTTGCDCRVQDLTDPAACNIEGSLRVYNSAYISDPEILQGWTGDSSFYFEPSRGMVFEAPQQPITGVVLNLASADGDFAIDLSLSSAGLSSLCSRSSVAMPGIQPCL